MLLKIVKHIKNSMAIILNGKPVAFTIAEVLITLVIIGIIAALTIPSVIQNHKNLEVEAKLKKIYIDMNEAIKISEFNNGNTTDWIQELATLEGVQTYILPYLKATKVEEDSKTNHIFIYLPNGSILAKRKPKGDKNYYGNWSFITKDSKDCKEMEKKVVGVCVFDFYFNYAPTNSPSSVKRLFEPYDYYWDGTRDGLMHVTTGKGTDYGCGDKYRSYCTKLIQYHGWKIPKDYPHRVK